MATYRQIYLTFWTDTKIDEEFTPEDKYFYLYLLTNPHTNICGCYEIGYKQMARETGYNEDTVRRLVARMRDLHRVVDYDETNKEMLVINWAKHNWSKSTDLLKGVKNAVVAVKTDRFREYLKDEIDGLGTVYRGSIDPVGTSVTVTDTDTVTATDTVKKKEQKHRFGEYGHVLLTDEELRKLQERYHDWHRRITEMDEAIERKGYKYKSHYLAILDWARRDAKKQSNGYDQFMTELAEVANGK